MQPIGTASWPDEPKGWRKGPLPPDTYGWGGVVPKDTVTHGGFFFADFQGDKVIAFMAASAAGEDRTLKPEDVAWFNNDLGLPPAYEN